MKATSIFGGVQVFNIIINIIRSKFVAILLGPTGMGIAGLLTSTISLISGVTNFGLGTSAVKDISSANSTNDAVKISETITVVRRWVWITGLLGAVLTFSFSNFLSELTFGNYNYHLAFKWIAITLLINQLSTGQSVVLRGLRKIQYLAKAGMFGSIIGLLTTIPLYYIYGLEGIVPAMIVTSIVTFLLTWYYSSKVKINSSKITPTETFEKGKGMLQLGFMISLSSLIALGASYIVRIFISKTGGVDQVGLYNAGFAIINSYVGMIFTAMSTDYYPRLSEVSSSNEESRLVINHQSEIALLILSPVIMIFLVFINWVVLILYSSKFIEVNDMILWAALGIFFKAVSWSIAFIFLAKGSSKLYFWNELVTNIYLLALNLIGYKYYGLTGLGISFMIGYMLYLIQVYIVAHYKYQFYFNKGFYKIFVTQIFLAIICMLAVKLLNNMYSYLFGSLIIAISSVIAYKELDNRMDVKSMVKIIKNKFRSK